MGSTAALMPQLLTLSGWAHQQNTVCGEGQYAALHLGSVNFKHELPNLPGQGLDELPLLIHLLNSVHLHMYLSKALHAGWDRSAELGSGKKHSCILCNPAAAHHSGSVDAGIAMRSRNLCKLQPLEKHSHVC